MKTTTGKSLQQSATDRRGSKLMKGATFKRTVVPRSKLKRPARSIVEVAAPQLFVRQGELKFHPLLKRVGLLPALINRETEKGNAQGKGRAAHKAAAEEMSRDFESLVKSISNHGIREKLKVIKTTKGEWLVVDGRHRYEAAVEAMRRYVKSDAITDGPAEMMCRHGLPCEEVREADVVPIIMDAVNRRHLTKGARAYLAVLMQPEVATTEKRGGDRSKTALNAVLPPASPSALNAEGLALTAGVSPRLIEDAVALYKQFEARPDVRKKFEDAIWVGAGLAKLLAGIKGFLTTGKEPDEEEETEEQAKARIGQERIETAMQKWVGVTTAFKHWETIPLPGRETITDAGIKAILALPEDVMEAISAALLRREFKP